MAVTTATVVPERQMKYRAGVPEQNMVKRILIVSFHFYPDAAVGARRMSELARYLCQAGYQVVVITARPEYEDAVVDPTLALDLPGLRRIEVRQLPKLLPTLLTWIKRVRGRGSHESSADLHGPGESPAQETPLQRLKRLFHSLEQLVDVHKLWAVTVGVRAAALAVRQPFDAVISSGPPMSAHLAVLLARPLLRSRWIMDLRDPWCDQNHGRPDLHSSVSRRLNRFLERRALTSADAITVTTPSYAELLRARYSDRSSDIQLVLNGFDQDLERSLPPQGRLELLYAGTLYYNRNPIPLLNAISRFLARPDVDRSRFRFRMFGPVVTWRGIELNQWLAERGLQDCVSVHLPLPAAEIHRLMREVNVLVSFAQGQPLQIPAKMFECLAARRDVLLIAELDGDSAWLTRQAGCGQVVAPDDEDGMEAALAGFYDKYVSAPRNAQFNTANLLAYRRECQNERFVQLLSEGVAVRQEVG